MPFFLPGDIKTSGSTGALFPYISICTFTLKQCSFCLCWLMVTE